MATTWFRFYDEVVDDPKVQLLSPLLFKTWINFLCIASKNTQDRGRLPVIEHVAHRLKATKSRAEALLQELVAVGLFEWKDGIACAHNWDDRQFQSDRSTDRVQRWRKQHRNGERNNDETFHETLRNGVTETHQIQNRAEQRQNPSVVSPKSKRPKKQKTPPPETLEISEQMQEWAQDNGFTVEEIRRETPEMLDHFRAIGEAREDWPATWRNWMRRSRRFAGKRNNSNGNGVKPGAIPPCDRVEMTPEFIAECERDIARMKGAN